MFSRLPTYLKADPYGRPVCIVKLFTGTPMDYRAREVFSAFVHVTEQMSPEHSFPSSSILTPFSCVVQLYEEAKSPTAYWDGLWVEPRALRGAWQKHVQSPIVSPKLYNAIGSLVSLQ